MPSLLAERVRRGVAFFLGKGLQGPQVDLLGEGHHVADGKGKTMDDQALPLLVPHDRVPYVFRRVQPPLIEVTARSYGDPALQGSPKREGRAGALLPPSAPV